MGRVGCASGMVWRAAFPGDQDLMLARSGAVLMTIADHRSMVVVSDGLT